MFKCSESGCGFVAQSRAGLVNHRRQKHRQQKHSASALTPCQFCRRTFRPQGLRNHEMFCSSCPKTSEHFYFSTSVACTIHLSEGRRRM